MAKRLGVYIFDGVEMIDWSAPVGVFAVARRMDPELDAFVIAESPVPIKTTANVTVVPKYTLDQKPDMDAFLIPGGIGTRAEMDNGKLRDFIISLPEKTLLVSVCTGAWIYGQAGLLDDLFATSRKHADPFEAMTPLQRLHKIAPRCRCDEHRIVDNGKILSAGGITAGLEMGLYLLERFGYDEEFVNRVAYIMEYDRQWELMKRDRLVDLT